MNRPVFAGSFFLHPVYLISIVVLVINNLWFKSSGLFPWLAGKLSDIAIMIFLPALICLGVQFLRHMGHTAVMVFKRNQINKETVDYTPSMFLIIAAIAISAGLMTAMQFSETTSAVYYQTILTLNDWFFAGRITHPPVADPTDLLSLLFLIIPYYLLSKTRVLTC